MLVQDFLHESAARRPDKVALVCQGCRLTYAELDAAANRLANALRERGVARGDRVAIHLNNTVEAVVAVFATLEAGAVFVFLNRTTKPDKLRRILDDCRAAVLVTDARSLAEGAVEVLLASVASLRGAVVVAGPDGPAPARDPRCWDYAALLAAQPARRPPVVNAPDDLACLVYTSGTTGEAKGVMSGHDNVVFASGAIIRILGNTERDVVINVLPLSFDYGLYQLLMAFRIGGTLVLENSFAYTGAVLQLMERERVTGLPGVPTVFALLLQMDLTRFDLSALRYLTNTAAALPVAHVRELRRRLPHATLFSMYGLTETKRTLWLPPEWLDTKPDSVGVALPGTEVWLEDESGRRLGPGEVGELVARGPHVMRGYWEAPEATAARFRPGPVPGERVCHSGDLFRMDAEGCMYFVARQDDIIKSRGEKVAPREVEETLRALDGVADVAVVGVPDPILGQAIKAVVVRARPELTAGEVICHCRARLEDYMVPRIVEFRDAVPRSVTGKVLRHELV